MIYRMLLINVRKTLIFLIKKKKKNAKRKWEFHTIRTIEAFFISFRLIAKI